MNIQRYDYVVIGGGIVGVSTALQLQQRQPNKSVLLLEKESGLAQHQSGHNSGVIHAGVYYPPESLKAKFCRQGAIDTIEFCHRHKIPVQQCGKLIVATNGEELERLRALFTRCQKNAVETEWLDEQQLRHREPNVEGVAAMLVASTAITDYPKIVTTMAEEFERLGGRVVCGVTVDSLLETADSVFIGGLHLSLQRFSARTDQLVVCAGLMADRMTRMMGLATDFQIIPFRGEYYRLPEKFNELVSHLIYPVPNPELPFLGVHLTRMIDGSITVGPNAVQGLKREGYGSLNLSWRDCREMIGFVGFWKLLKNHFWTGVSEWKNSIWKPGYLALVQKYCPQITLSDLQPHPAGIRAQAVMKDGSLVHDFLFSRSERSLHVCNAPSPAATSALPIGRHIVDQLLEGQ
ncbi:MAG: L-2-hydroxyglutarate oxidase [Cellvibrionaceae bacterium]